MRFERKNWRKVWTDKKTVWALSLLLIVAITTGTVFAFLTSTTKPVENTFVPGKPGIEVDEDFDGAKKENVTVENTGNIPVYARVKLVTYRVKEINGEMVRIGGKATLPDFTLGANWVYHGGFYYYTLPIEPGQKPKENLTDSMELVKEYKDADGGRQVVEVMAECIQSEPEDAVQEAWGVSITPGSVTPSSGN